ncbi:hypothetical protein BJY27_007908 [Streptomyces rapamycinicus]|nr:hypothetical protein [Streptomyces rapamycinicus]
MGEPFALAPFRRTTMSGFSVRSRGFRVRDMMFNRFETAAALRTGGRRVGADDHVRLWIVHRGAWRFGEPGGAEHTAPAGAASMLFVIGPGRSAWTMATSSSGSRL